VHKSAPVPQRFISHPRLPTHDSLVAAAEPRSGLPLLSPLTPPSSTQREPQLTHKVNRLREVSAI
jgi:hypothetical protein